MENRTVKNMKIPAIRKTYNDKTVLDFPETEIINTGCMLILITHFSTQADSLADMIITLEDSRIKNIS